MRWQAISYRRRWQMMLGVFAFLILMVWRLAISITIQQVRAVIEGREALKIVDVAPVEMIALEEKLAKVKLTYSENNDGSRALMEMIAACCEHFDVTLAEKKKPERSEEAGFVITDHRFTLYGSFHALTHALHFVEKEYKSGYVRSVRYFLVTNIRTKRNTLGMQVLVRELTQAKSMPAEE